jgi:acyl-CoA synthetase (AMP-forming)/AMP-acid ligase II
MAALDQITTLIELLAFRAKATPETVAYTFLDDSRSYGELWTEITRFATFLKRLGVEQGDRVLIALPNGLEFFPAFYGVQRAGAIAVPLFPGFSPDRFLTMAGLCGAHLVVLPSEMGADQRAELDGRAGQREVSVVTVAESEGVTATADLPQVDPDDVAFIQYTSGSTGDPKGVMLAHRNLLANVREMIEAMVVRAEDVYVSWLPLYHDMGLIIMTMVPFYMGAGLHLLPAKLTSVRIWLESIEKHNATFTASPDFGYRLAMRRITKPEKHDLSSLRLVLNAAEPVRAGTIRDFEAKFGLKDVMAAAYGLAEATVFVTLWGPSRAAKVDERGFVSVGRPGSDIVVTIWEGEQRLGPGQVGEVVINSPANCQGYFQNQRATEKLFWGEYGIRSGDLGYLDEEGDLFIVGRKKNSIIHAGQTVYPGEIEEIVSQVEGVRMTAAVGIDRGGVEGEQATIFAEVRGRRARWDPAQEKTALETMVIEIVGRFYERFGFRPGRVYLVKPRTIPQTANGKLQHQLLKERFLKGELTEKGAILFHSGSDAPIRCHPS